MVIAISNLSPLYDDNNALIILQDAYKRKIPKYWQVFSSDTITDILRTIPVTMAEVAGLAGMGEIKSSKYGEELIATIHSFLLKFDLLHLFPNAQTPSLPACLSWTDPIQFHRDRERGSGSDYRDRERGSGSDYRQVVDTSDDVIDAFVKDKNRGSAGSNAIGIAGGEMGQQEVNKYVQNCSNISPDKVATDIDIGGNHYPTVYPGVVGDKRPFRSPVTLQQPVHKSPRLSTNLADRKEVYYFESDSEEQQFDPSDYLA